MFKGETLQGRILSVEDHMISPEPSGNLEISNKLLSRCSYGTCESNVKSIKYLEASKEPNRQADTYQTSNNTKDFLSIENGSTQNFDFGNQHASQFNPRLSSNDVRAYTYGRYPSVYEKLCIEIKFDEASHDFPVRPTFPATNIEDLYHKPEKPKVMIFGDVMEQQRRDEIYTAQYIPKENRFKYRASPTDSKTHSINALNSSETASIYQKSKTLLRKASGLFTEKPPSEGRTLSKSQSSISLREAARSSNSKNPVLNRKGSVSKFVGSMKVVVLVVLASTVSKHLTSFFCSTGSIMRYLKKSIIIHPLTLTRAVHNPTSLLSISIVPNFHRLFLFPSCVIKILHIQTACFPILSHLLLEDEFSRKYHPNHYNPTPLFYASFPNTLIC
ncbi:hypothetical protein K493DRAFT_378455 [Basidiobolus meristosporus CBS 931.73]|uniref:Uncharacterized protein n=1 Tax=Basidiobolus meristosporus CBS 931.73 TaxID=1314790 RepID=A0A1Y1Y0Q8_9FUNG|nr:hypothetical protein K493DRAFT_378455 [Basidiobolus meristosporus CBS 931.73]|eukprot:ORX91580.1 hypothetical protein K493DRAFT_378455 [Basidiobolus meristosporus CBS 931.73]